MEFQIDIRCLREKHKWDYATEPDHSTEPDNSTQPDHDSDSMMECGVIGMLPGIVEPAPPPTPPGCSSSFGSTGAPPPPSTAS